MPGEATLPSVQARPPLRAALAKLRQSPGALPWAKTNHIKYMKRNLVKIITLTAVVGLAGLVLTGCSKSDTENQPAPGTNALAAGTNQPVQGAIPQAQATNAAAQKSAQTVQYTCSMHPDVVQDKPGTCPKCGMKLVEKR